MNAIQCDSDETICDSEEDDTAATLKSSPSLLQGLSRIRGREQTHSRTEDETLSSVRPMSPVFLAPATKLQRVSSISYETKTSSDESSKCDSNSPAAAVTHVASTNTDVEDENLELKSVHKQLDDVEETLKTMSQSIGVSSVESSSEIITRLKSIMATVRSQLSKLNQSQIKQRQQLSQTQSQLSQNANSTVAAQAGTREQLKDLARKQREIISLYKKFKELLNKFQALKHKKKSPLEILLPSERKHPAKTQIEKRTTESLDSANDGINKEHNLPINSKQDPSFRSNIISQPQNSQFNSLRGTTITTANALGVPTNTSGCTTVTFVSLPGSFTAPGGVIPQILPQSTLSASKGTGVISPVVVLAQAGVTSSTVATVCNSVLATSALTTNHKSQSCSRAIPSFPLVIPTIDKSSCNSSQAKSAVNTSEHTLTEKGKQTRSIATVEAPNAIAESSKSTAGISQLLSKTATCTSTYVSSGLQLANGSQSFGAVNYESQTDTSEISQSILTPLALSKNLLRHRPNQIRTISNNKSTTTAFKTSLSNSDVTIHSKHGITYTQGDQMASKTKGTGIPNVADGRNASRLAAASPISCTGAHNREFPDLKMLLDQGHIQSGTNVLTVETEGRKFHASLKKNGTIESAGGETFHTPLAWLKAVTGSKRISLKQAAAYKMISFRGKPLSSFGMQPAEENNNTKKIGIGSGNEKNQPYVQDELQPKKGQDNVSSGRCNRSRESSLITTMYAFSRLLRSCQVIPIADEEFAPTNVFLPDNFWEVDFDSINLDQHILKALNF